MATPPPGILKDFLRLRGLQKSLLHTFSIENSPTRFLKDLGKINLQNKVEGEWLDDKPEQLKEK